MFNKQMYDSVMMYVCLLGNVGNVVFQDTPVRVTAIVGESAVLECAPAGEIKIYITWTPMPSNSQLYNKEYGGVLRIDDVMLSNEGVYNCSYTWSHENYTANGTRQFHLTVKGTQLVHVM